SIRWATSWSTWPAGSSGPPSGMPYGGSGTTRRGSRCPGGRARPMPEALPSSFDPTDPGVEARRAANLALLEALRADLEAVVGGGGPKYVERHRERGRLLVRERIDLLLDPDAPFLELMPLAGWGTTDPLGGAVVVGL